MLNRLADLAAVSDTPFRDRELGTGHGQQVARHPRSADASAAPSNSVGLMLQRCEQLVQIWTSNEQQSAELRILKSRLNQAVAYLASGNCHEKLGYAYLEFLTRKCAERIEALRHNRRNAAAVLDQIDESLPQPALAVSESAASHRRFESDPSGAMVRLSCFAAPFRSRSQDRASKLTHGSSPRLRKHA